MTVDYGQLDRDNEELLREREERRGTATGAWVDNRNSELVALNRPVLSRVVWELLALYPEDVRAQHLMLVCRTVELVVPSVVARHTPEQGPLRDVLRHEVGVCVRAMLDGTELSPDGD